MSCCSAIAAGRTNSYGAVNIIRRLPVKISFPLKARLAFRGAWLLAVFSLVLSGQAQSLLVEKPGAADFPLSTEKGTATILVEPAADPAVVRAAGDLASDIERVTGRKPSLVREAVPLSGDAVFVGVLGESPLLDGLVARGKLDADGLKGSWESYVVQVVDAPLPNVRRALVIAGSDRRGAIYGLYEVSETIGVSPWHWWADVTPDRRDALYLEAGARRFGPPSVKYRGIFINDEDWGLQPWAARTHEPENGDLGPKTYARLFELLLRLKANLVWPAMHPSTKPFNDFAENKVLADRYGIVMGSSHAEPMLRNNVGEWKAPAAAYNYLTNRAGVLDYWEKRLQENGRYENIYTLGMRGIHDSNMIGPRTDAERIAALEKIFADQRTLLQKYARKPDAAPQMFCVYKEVLDLYRQGLKVPDDVTIVWPDDNFGFIRTFATAGERQRRGGFGIYYHLSYLGAPLAYLWLNTTPPGLIWEEMHKAYEHGADRIWIANVGDLKPAEIATEFFLEMAWDIRRWNAGNLDQYLVAWATREFGAGRAVEIAAVMAEYYRLNFVRKPEHLQWWLPGQRFQESPFSPVAAAARLADFRRIAGQTQEIESALPAAKRDAFFELVKYPVLGATAANERYFHSEAYARLFNYDLGAARQHATLARAADDRLTRLTQEFNETIAGGKWRHLMSLEPADNQWRSFRIAPAALPAASLAAPLADLAALPFGPVRSNATPPVASIVVDPAKFTVTTAVGGASWTPLAGFARVGTMITVLPTTVPSVEPGSASGEAPSVEYLVDLPAAGKYRVRLDVLPTHPLERGRLMRVLINLGEAPAQLVTTGARDGSPEWAQAVLNGFVQSASLFEVANPGRTRLRLQMVDPGIVIEGIALEPASVGEKSSP